MVRCEQGSSIKTQDDVDEITHNNKPNTLDYDTPRELTVRERIFLAILGSSTCEDAHGLYCRQRARGAVQATDEVIDMLKERQS